MASYNVAVVSGAVVKRLHYISEMSQNYVCLNHRDVDYNLLAYTAHTLKNINVANFRLRHNNFKLSCVVLKSSTHTGLDCVKISATKSNAWAPLMGTSLLQKLAKSSCSSVSQLARDGYVPVTRHFVN